MFQRVVNSILARERIRGLYSIEIVPNSNQIEFYKNSIFVICDYKFGTPGGTSLPLISFS